MSSHATHAAVRPHARAALFHQRLGEPVVLGARRTEEAAGHDGLARVAGSEVGPGAFDRQMYGVHGQESYECVK